MSSEISYFLDSGDSFCSIEHVKQITEEEKGDIIINVLCHDATMDEIFLLESISLILELLMIQQLKKGH